MITFNDKGTLATHAIMFIAAHNMSVLATCHLSREATCDISILADIKEAHYPPANCERGCKHPVI